MMMMMIIVRVITIRLVHVVEALRPGPVATTEPRVCIERERENTHTHT